MNKPPMVKPGGLCPLTMRRRVAADRALRTWAEHGGHPLGD